ncbi:MAG TPA: asparagine synthase (glutamine-hydrolyzing), partial [Rhodospirillales bacterium]|nr:asparagine synthase (glutamine-hydrolyzing) [Rhodospirillales bacterium]
MCGLCAIFSYGSAAPPVAESELLGIRDAMVSRGPDGAGLWVGEEGRIGLGHRRLSIIDLSTGAAQPMSLDGGRLRITYNGEIYNYRALRRELEDQGRVFRTGSDTEVLLHLYDALGPAMAERLRGMFAFALWDRERQGLFLARDPFGVKPLYVADDGKTLRCASQVKALLAGGGVDRAPDPAGHVGFFLFGSVPEPHTLYAAIRPLPAGGTLWVDRSGTHREGRFFDLGETLAGTEDETPAPLDLRRAFKDSVFHHLVADVPVGVFLSSGIDSAALTGLASEEHGAGLATVTLGFDEFEGTPRDETPLAETIAALYGADHETVRVAGKDFAKDLGAVFAAMDQPTIDGVNVYFVAKAAAQKGLKVALSGLGGDELLCGYDTFSHIPRLVGALGWMPGGRGLGRSLRMVSASLAHGLGSPKAAGILELGTRFGDAYLLRRGLFMPWELGRVLDPGMAREGWRALEPLALLNATENNIEGPLRKVAALEMTWYMRNQLLRDADWAGMAHSL